MNAASLPPARDLGESERSQHHPVGDLVHQLRSRATSTRENKGSLTTKCLFYRGLQIPIFHICTSFEGVLIPKTNFCVDFTELTGLSCIRIPASNWTPRGLKFNKLQPISKVKGLVFPGCKPMQDESICQLGLLNVWNFKTWRDPLILPLKHIMFQR